MPQYIEVLASVLTLFGVIMLTFGGALCRDAYRTPLSTDQASPLHNIELQQRKLEKGFAVFVLIAGMITTAVGSFPLLISFG